MMHTPSSNYLLNIHFKQIIIAEIKGKNKNRHAKLFLQLKLAEKWGEMCTNGIHNE